MLLGVNMQTSFMHPPFGFALFYLRSVAPTMPYLDKLTGRRMAPVTTGQIYWGAVPFVMHPGHHGRPGHRLPADGHALQGRRHRRRSEHSIQQLDIPQMEDLPPLDFGAPPGLEGGGAPPGLEGPASPPADLGPPPGLEGPPPGLEPPPPPQPAQ